MKQFGFVSCGDQELFLHAAYIADADECEAAQCNGLLAGDRLATDIAKPPRGASCKQAQHVRVLAGAAREQ